MSKPLGVALGVSEDGPTMRVTRPSSAEDAIWRAVEEAQCAGWTAKQFKREVAQAWKEQMERQAKWDADTLRK